MKTPRDPSLGLPRELLLAALVFGLLMAITLCARHAYTALAPQPPSPANTQQ